MSLEGKPAGGVNETIPEGTKIAIVASTWYTEVMNGLIAGAERACAEAGVECLTFRVPGSFELSLGCQWALQAGFDAAVALGVVVRGGTPHFDYVCDAATEGLNRVGLDAGRPIGFGLLTCDDEQQALDRAGLLGAKEDKGYEAAQAVLQMLELYRQLRI